MTTRHRLLSKVFIIASCLMVMASCTVVSEGSPVSNPDDVSETSSSDTEPLPSEEELPSDGAPKVTKPIDAGRFEQDPCAVLTPEQADELGVDPTGKPDEDAFGKICRWRNPDTLNGGSTTINFFSIEKRGLSSVYRSYNRGEFKYFAPIEVEGQPAAAYDINRAKPTAACFVAVGLTDQLVFSSYTTLSSRNVDKRDPCEAGAQVAGMMVKTMRGSS
jgi:hypothetical protein